MAMVRRGSHRAGVKVAERKPSRKRQNHGDFNSCEAAVFLKGKKRWEERGENASPIEGGFLPHTVHGKKTTNINESNGKGGANIVTGGVS